MNIPKLRQRPILLFQVLALIALALSARAQSDNFDAGTLDPAWKRSHFNAGLVNLSFPDSASGGKGMRIQASPVPNAAPAAAMFYRDNVYTDFYLAVDIANWPGTDKNQAIVLLARASLSANPATTTGIILNYDASQYGENPTDRRQGQLQINMVTNSPAFGTKTIAVAECTLEPGRPYRMVFKATGSRYTGQVFDLHDLTRPVVTIEADDDIQGQLPGGGNLFFDAGFKSGVCGFLSFSRQGTTGTTDVTIDNYFAGAAEPTPNGGSGITHPVAGTPVVDTRVPADRFKNFHNPADGISFTAKTHNAELINASATKLRLNGVDVSSQLVLPANASTISVTLPGSALQANKVYNAQIELEDTTGTKKSVNTFWFDTFSDAYLSSSAVKTIEAEEYNYNNGQFQADPIPVSGLDTNGAPVNGGGVGYWELAGTKGIDFHDARDFPESPWAGEFRSFDPVGLSAGMYPEINDLVDTSDAPIRRSDNIRAKYASTNLLEYVVHRTEPGEWLNYTRNITAGSYAAYLRVASFGATVAELHRVTSDPAAENQTTTKLGTFNIPNQLTRYNYRYIPLVDDQGAPVLLNLSGEQTLRLQMAGTAGQDVRKVALNYIALVPQTATPATIKVFSSATVDGTFTEETSVGVSTNPIVLPVTGDARFYRLQRSDAATGTFAISSIRKVGANVEISHEVRPLVP